MTVPVLLRKSQPPLTRGPRKAANRISGGYDLNLFLFLRKNFGVTP